MADRIFEHPVFWLFDSMKVQSVETTFQIIRENPYLHFEFYLTSSCLLNLGPRCLRPLAKGKYRRSKAKPGSYLREFALLTVGV